MEKINIDNGQKFDFGKTSKEYGKYRDIYPQQLFDRLYELGVGKKGTDPQVIVPKIKAMLKPNGMFMKIYMSYVKDDSIAGRSWALVKELNKNWSGGSGVKDLTTHYFDNPQMESFTVDLPFTRESWHGRMKASRGVLASMNEETLRTFEEEHWKIMMELPEEFVIKHKVFLTYYYLNK